MKKRKEVVAITGGCGRIGSALAEDLLKLGYKVLLGDINQDGFVDILDAIEVVNLVLNGEYNELVDMNYDGTINILDIIDIIYIILN